MTIRIFRDIEEAISREIRRITFDEDRSVSHTVLKDAFDPFTGELVKLPIEPDFYDSSADTKFIQYPHVFVKLLRVGEDRDSGRVIPAYGFTCEDPVLTSPKAYQILIYRNDGAIDAPGEDITTSALNIGKAQPGHFLRILKGPNTGTYIIDSVTKDNSGIHTITVSDVLITDLPEIVFDSVNRIINFSEPQDLSTIDVGDTFEDASLNQFNISAIDLANNTITIGGVLTPNTAEGSKIRRLTGDVFKVLDPDPVTFVVMDPTKPILSAGGVQTYTTYELANPAIPLDIFYLVRIDSKERDTHIDVANRMWEEFNPPRTGLPTIIRTKLSGEQLITQDVATGGSNTLLVSDNSDFNVNDSVFVFNDIHPTKDIHGDGFEEPFAAKVISKIGTTQIVLDSIVPDTFTVSNRTKIVSNADYRVLMFHLEDHVTRDVEGAQYWSHEFTFWVQAWVDRQGLPVIQDGVVQEIGISGGTGTAIDGPTILDCT